MKGMFMKRSLNVLLVFSVLCVSACSFSLGAEKLNLDAKTAKKPRKLPPDLPPVFESTEVSARGDQFVPVRMFV